MVRVGVLGAAGRMGREVCRAVGASDDLELVAAVDPAAPGAELRDLAGPEVPAMSLAAGVEALEKTGVEVAVDFTVPSAVRENLAWCARQGVHAVVGTTGLGEADLEEVRALFAGSAANALVVPNFAVGAVLLMRFCELAAPFMDGVEIIELHHGAKKDAPSGTALRTAERTDAARRAAKAPPWRPEPTTVESLAGARGGDGPGSIRVHAVRLPGLVAHQEVIFGSVGETLTVRHDSSDRISFMPGVLLAVRRVGSLPGLTVGLESLLGL